MVSARQPKSSRVDWDALVATFREAVYAGDLVQFRRRRWEYDDNPGSWLETDNLTILTQSQADSLYRAAGGRHITKFRANPIEDIRDSVDFLLYDTIKLENRLLVDGLRVGRIFESLP